MFDIIGKFDAQVTGFINFVLPHNTFFNYFFSFFSQKGASVLIWIGIILLLVIFEEKKDKKFILCFLISFAVAGIISNLFLKNLFRRPRPQINLAYGKISNTCPKDFSFPSGHATTAFAAAAALAYFDKKRKYLYYLVAGLIGLSRIYLQCHYFGDVAVGGIIGYLIAKVILSNYSALRKSKSSRGTVGF